MCVCTVHGSIQMVSYSYMTSKLRVAWGGGRNGGACMRHVLIMSRIRGVVNYDVSHKCSFFFFVSHHNKG